MQTHHKNTKNSILKAEVHPENDRYCLGQVGYSCIRALL